MLAKYKYLLTYRYSEIIHDLIVVFIKKYVLGSFSNLGRPDYRSADQMNQAARSGKQNIVEAVGQSQTSKKGEIKLLGVANASLEELIVDLEDFLRQRGFRIYPKDDPRVTRFRQTAYRLSHLSNLSDLGNLKEKPELPENPEEAANFLLTLCHLATFLLNKQIRKAEETFITEGGYSENLFKRRLESKIH
ncbi:four helix bundle protein [Candidatus Daviesbacteria bacterium]|nr:four helix bundle protein [Candidatus Daviesbacteria bacterium]